MGISANQYREICRNLGLDPVTGDVPKANKYGARKKEIDGVVFDSTAEARRYVELMAMRMAGEIEDLILQPRFLLQEKFRDAKQKAHRKIEYVADFSYYDTSTKLRVVEDVKGMRTEAFKLKWKLAVKRYPEVDFRMEATR